MGHMWLLASLKTCGRGLLSFSRGSCLSVSSLAVEEREDPNDPVLTHTQFTSMTYVIRGSFIETIISPTPKPINSMSAY